MTPSFTERARNEWALLPAPLFEAVYQVRSALDDVAESDDWRHVNVIGDFAIDTVEIKALENLGFVLLVEATALQVFALGMPGL